MTSMTSAGVGKDATAINAFVGYNYNENLGAELGYLSTGDWDIAGKDFSSKGPPCRSLVVCRWGTSSRCLPKGGYLYHVDSINGGDNNLAPLAGLGLTAN
jgi:OOP family OmpA-OmpF porin